MSSARRSLLTATAAGTLLGALWFVPSANATDDHPASTASAATSTTQARVSTATATQISSTTGDGTQLADTGSFDTTPYVIGGTMFLTLGAGFVVYSVRRERLGF
ncbi:LPXTG cell wall anchor domain-containing protein [Streptomyces sp. YU58]|uniref:LPXTG cell wall anchor domain-containing protein n=1 Tax=Streptomyces sp. SX92 TaxID=3158972 RepID=UPI0027B8C6CA|nr:LPXTG cell wall anchor domain-containing protein [Streptomyces coralus]WLW52625.1 LPXTG cell wall anchor domain-containing protein [Streptomyces coralus]